MYKRYILGILAAGLSICLSGCPSSPLIALSPEAGREVLVSGTYTHRATGVQFPEQFIPFVRARIWEFNAAGDNIGIGYNLNSFREPTIITVYLYPGPSVSAQGNGGGSQPNPQQVLDGHYKEVLLDILASHKDSKILAQEPFDLSQSGQALRGKRAIVQFRENFAGQEQSCISCLYLFLHKNWFIKYRVTCPAAVYDLAQENFECFIRDFPILPLS